VLASTGEVNVAKAPAAELGVAQIVSGRGWVDGNVRVILLRRATPFVLQSCADTMPAAGFVAMAIGLTSAATRIVGVPHAVCDAEDGVLVKPRDLPELARALIFVLGDQLRCDALGGSARLGVEQNFAADLIVPHIRVVWQDVRAARSGGGTV
jgi:glycosyltransferase involved in cell wall biosynthesis